MANKWPLASGNWSNAANWNGGVKPGASDDVYADGKTVTIDEDVTVASLKATQRTGGTAGGKFTTSGDWLITCGQIWGYGNTCVEYTGSGTLIIVVTSIYGGQTIWSYGVSNTGAGTVMLTCNLGSYGQVANSGTGTVQITGSIFQTYNGADAASVTNSGAGHVVLVGDATGGALVGKAIKNTGTGSVKVDGSATGGGGTGYAVHSTNVAGAVWVTGDCTTGETHAVHSAGRVRVDGDQVAAVSGLGQGLLAVYAPSLQIGPAVDVNWSLPAAGEVFPNYAGTAAHLYAAGAAAANQAAQSDVRSGTVYGPSDELTGTCHVPGAASVLSGVPVDATVGTATIDAASIRAAVGLASANLDAQFSAIEVNPQSIRDAMKLASSAGAAAAGSIDDQLATKPSTAAVGALLAAALDAP